MKIIVPVVQQRPTFVGRFLLPFRNFLLFNSIYNYRKFVQKNDVQKIHEFSPSI